MRRLAALLAAVLLPASAWAQMRAGAVAEAGLGVSAAPVPAIGAPALQLSPSALSPASLSPALAVPAPLAAPAPAAAVKPAAAPSEKAAPAALASISPAAAKPEKPGSDQARAAASALFDGTVLKAPAASEGPSVPGSAPEDRRSSGLSPPTDAELTAAYRQARPGSRAVETFGRDFAAVAGEAVQQYTFMGEYFLQQLKRGPMRDAAEDLIKTHDAREDGASRRFMQLLGAWYAFKDHAREKLFAMQIKALKGLGRSGPAPHLPPSTMPGGEYWDMAAGMNAQGFIHRELEPGTNYSFFDYSPFVVSYLETAARLAGAGNVAVVEADLNALTRPAKPLAVLRTKNAVHYVPGFDRKLEKMADWIAPGGRLYIQNDPSPGQRSLIIEKHGPLIRRLIAEGWEFEFGFSGARGKWGEYGLDTIALTRPKSPAVKTAEGAAKEWAVYEGAVRYLEARFNPFAGLFR